MKAEPAHSQCVPRVTEVPRLDGLQSQNASEPRTTFPAQQPQLLSLAPQQEARAHCRRQAEPTPPRPSGSHQTRATGPRAPCAAHFTCNTLEVTLERADWGTGCKPGNSGFRAWKARDSEAKQVLLTEMSKCSSVSFSASQGGLIDLGHENHQKLWVPSGWPSPEPVSLRPSGVAPRGFRQ